LSRRSLLGGAAAVTVAGAGGLAGGLRAGAAQRPPHGPPVGVATATVERGDLIGTSKSPGSLAYAGAADAQAGLSGVVTWTPAAGSEVTRGRPLFAVDNHDVHLLRGQLPAWRAFAAGMADGPDVHQLEENLKAMGFFGGTPDARFTAVTASAIRKWQKATKREQTGRIALGEIVFRPEDVRIAQVKAKVGERVAAGAPVVAVTGLTKQVSVRLRLADQQLAKVHATVRIQLPGATTTTGTVWSVGVAEQQDPSDPKSPVVIPVGIALDDPAAAASFQQASVVVDFPTQTRRNVLSVPLIALLAMPGTGFGVELLRQDGTTEQVPVTPGLFAGDRVEVSGDRLAAGQRVVIPA
jgi:peptidoglycan hydrolase-like protein with peptidoglycan-binding domain